MKPNVNDHEVGELFVDDDGAKYILMMSPMKKKNWMKVEKEETNIIEREKEEGCDDDNDLLTRLSNAKSRRIVIPTREEVSCEKEESECEEEKGCKSEEEKECMSKDVYEKIELCKDNECVVLKETKKCDREEYKEITEKTELCRDNECVVIGETKKYERDNGCPVVRETKRCEKDNDNGCPAVGETKRCEKDDDNRRPVVREARDSRKCEEINGCPVRDSFETLTAATTNLYSPKALAFANASRRSMESRERTRLTGMWIIFSIPGCYYCTKAKNLFKEYGIKYTEIVVDKSISSGDKEWLEVNRKHISGYPVIFNNGRLIGGSDSLKRYLMEMR